MVWFGSNRFGLNRFGPSQFVHKLGLIGTIFRSIGRIALFSASFQNCFFSQLLCAALENGLPQNGSTGRSSSSANANKAGT
jgi:hypothetical protein